MRMSGSVSAGAASPRRSTRSRVGWRADCKEQSFCCASRCVTFHAVPMLDVLVVGAGLSGLSFAYHAAQNGREVRVLEASDRAGGCLHTHTATDGFWLELGGHTLYNSYGATIEILEGLDLLAELQPRGKPVLRFLDGDNLLPGKNLGALLRRMSVPELMRSLPRAFATKQE